MKIPNATTLPSFPGLTHGRQENPRLIRLSDKRLKLLDVMTLPQSYIF